MSQLTYEASVYQRTVKYTNFKGQTNETTLYFALDPLALMQVIAGYTPKTNKRSGNPAKRDQIEPISDSEQLKFVRDLAAKAAGWPSDDGESWEPFDGFADTIAGKAFLTKLASSDTDRKEFSEKVILDPFRAFVDFSEQDPSNTKEDVAQLRVMLGQLEDLFTGKVTGESIEERRARLAAELKALENPGE